MPTQIEKAGLFHALHVKGNPVILFNIWDAGSAKVVAGAGAKALATGSLPVAMARDYADGENLPLADALANITRIVEQTDLPVSLDFEGAYNAEPEGIYDNVTQALGTGIVGLNFEDQVVGTDELYDIKTQARRVAAVRKAIDASGSNAYLNARTDIFLKAGRDSHDSAMLKQVLDRADVYISEGASGIFVPGLVDPDLIEELCASVSVPINILAIPGAPSTEILKQKGVARISYGPVPYRQLMAVLSDAAKEAFSR